MPKKRWVVPGVTLQSEIHAKLDALLREWRPGDAPWWRDWFVVDADEVEHASSPATIMNSFPDGLFDGATTARFSVSSGSFDDAFGVSLDLNYGFATVVVEAPDSKVRDFSDAVREVLTQYSNHTPESSVQPFKVFIAYGGGPAWEIVRDYLQRAGIEVDAFTESERVGEVTIDVVSQMIYSASMAVIVMTAAEQLRNENWHARQNVIHEAGFAQGVLGIRNTIILLEDGVELPSNLSSVTYIPFPRGAVHTTEDRVVARVRETKADRESNGFAGPG
ncbi:TIR domain-containing protein [Microbacterium maritypicum]